MQFNLHLKKIIEEEIKRVITEKLSSLVYHYTSIESMYKIAKSDKIILNSALSNTSDNFNTKELYYLSLTRVKNNNFGYAYKFSDSGARIEFNGDLLNQQFKGKALNYWGKDRVNATNNRIQDETEDRLFSTKSSINNLHNYINRIDVLIKPTSDTQRKYAYYLLKTSLRNYINIYGNQNEFNKQSEKTLNETLTSYDTYVEQEDSAPNVGDSQLKNYTKPIANILQLIYFNEVDKKELGKKIKEVLVKYGLERYNVGSILKIYNSSFYNLKELINKVQCDVQDLSVRPSDDGEKIIKILSDYFSEHNLRTYKDIYDYKTNDFDGYLNSEYFDYNISKRFFVYDHGYDSYIILNPNKDCFWDYITDRESFVENLYYETSDRHKSKSDFHYKEYLISLTKKNISVADMLSILDKLNLGEYELDYILEYGSFEEEEISMNNAYKFKIKGHENDENYVQKTFFKKK